MANSGSPLAGKRVVITRAVEQCQSLCRELEARGAAPEVMPMVAFGPPEDPAPLDAALRELRRFDWMFLTSQNAVRALAERCDTLGVSLPGAAASLRIAAVGPATSQAVERVGLKVDHVAATHQGVALAEELGGQICGRSVFLPRSDRANPALPEALERLGARVTEAVAYRTLPAAAGGDEQWREIARGAADAILFFSPSAVYHLMDRLGAERTCALESHTVFAAIGPVTAAALRQAGVRRIVIAPDTSGAGILDALAEHWQARAHAGVKHG